MTHFRIRKIFASLAALVFFGTNVMAVPHAANDPCTCPDGNSYERNDKIMIPAALIPGLPHGFALGTIFSIHGCNDATFQYSRYRRTNSFKPKKYVERNVTRNVCRDLKPDPRTQSARPRPIATTNASADPVGQGDYTVGLPQPLQAAPVSPSGLVATVGGFIVNENVVAVRNMKISGHKLHEGTLGQIVGPGSGDKVRVSFLKHSKSGKFVTYAELAGSGAVLGAAFEKAIPPGYAIVGMIGLWLAVAHAGAKSTNPVKKIVVEVDPLDLQPISP